MNFMYLAGAAKMPLWREAIRGHFPDAGFRFWPDEIDDKAAIDYAIVWNPPVGELRTIRP